MSSLQGLRKPASGQVRSERDPVRLLPLHTQLQNSGKSRRGSTRACLENEARLKCNRAILTLQELSQGMLPFVPNPKTPPPFGRLSQSKPSQHVQTASDELLDAARRRLAPREFPRGDDALLRLLGAGRTSNQTVSALTRSNKKSWKRGDLVQLPHTTEAVRKLHYQSLGPLAF